MMKIVTHKSLHCNLFFLVKILCDKSKFYGDINTGFNILSFMNNFSLEYLSMSYNAYLDKF